ncbi:hypothetical protein J2S43_004868 [Catenuloplanes nepalensis]|uniref:DUF4291 domain-containing protein n=1 Tax=Catenuloplanes nepalensis TaxID=587533 RepID=A0ABT9MZ98_9ACTN|nr:DUF4291 domain-containing protein [Catenuloplanes nepalensis]MDP9796356.1 hypothetical protein [Catenuloplanes nepalensis]
MSDTVPARQVRAVFTDETITVYQAYSPEIALPALAAGRFVPPFRPGRMTWIKPSFLWMMYRCGWATKPGQEFVLAIGLRRPGFADALRTAVPSHHTPGDRYPGRAEWSRAVKRSDVRVQWDPERDLRLNALPYRSLQVGLSGGASARYAGEWIASIEDVTPLARHIHALAGTDPAAAQALLPPERAYPLPGDVAAVIDATGPANP